MNRPFFAARIVAYDLRDGLPVTLLPKGNLHGGALWMHDGYSYVRDRLRNGISYLNCRMKRSRNNCPAKARINRKNVFIRSDEHTCH